MIYESTCTVYYNDRKVASVLFKHIHLLEKGPTVHYKYTFHLQMGRLIR